MFYLLSFLHFLQLIFPLDSQLQQDDLLQLFRQQACIRPTCGDCLGTSAVSQDHPEAASLLLLPGAFPAPFVGAVWAQERCLNTGVNKSGPEGQENLQLLLLLAVVYDSTDGIC